MKHFLIVVDMQKDFVDGALGTQEARQIVPKVADKILGFDGRVFATLDTHTSDYLQTAEGRSLPVPHCIKGTPGWMLNDEIANGVKLITKPACERICRFAFDYAAANGRKKVTAVHKANIMKLTDGMFLSTFREVAKDYPAIEADDCIIDALCMKLVQKPEQFDVLVAPNLYGDIISDLCAGLVGGLGFAPSANIGAKTRIYEAVHGSAPDIAGQNKANPSAILMAFAMMLNDLGMTDKAARLNAAILAQVAEGKAVTADIGGTATTTEFTDAVAARL